MNGTDTEIRPTGSTSNLVVSSRITLPVTSTTENRTSRSHASSGPSLLTTAKSMLAWPGVGTAGYTPTLALSTTRSGKRASETVIWIGSDSGPTVPSIGSADCATNVFV